MIGQNKIGPEDDGELSFVHLMAAMGYEPFGFIAV
jgi:hypothetical protein